MLARSELFSMSLSEILKNLDKLAIKLSQSLSGNHRFARFSIWSTFSTENDTFNQTEESAMFSIFFRNSKIFQSNQTTRIVNGEFTINTSSFVGSNVLAVTFLNVTEILPGKTIELKFKRSEKPNVSGKKMSKRSFWIPKYSKFRF